MFTESQPIHRDYIEYRVIDAALGVAECGTYVVRDATDAAPWPRDCPIHHGVAWQTAPLRRTERRRQVGVGPCGHAIRGRSVGEALIP